MSLTLLALVSALNDARTLITVATPLVEQAQALGLPDGHVFTDAELDQHAAAVGLNAQSLRDMVKT